MDEYFEDYYDHEHTESDHSMNRLQDEGNVKYIDRVRESNAWAQDFIDTKIKHEYYTNENCESEKEDACGFTTNSELRIEELAKYIQKHGSSHDKRYLYLVKNDYVHETCLTDTWVGHNRMAFIDTTAGPVEWGRSSKNAGLKSVDTLPTLRRSQIDPNIISLFNFYTYRSVEEIC